MRIQPTLEQFERRLIELGCPSRKVRTKVGDLALLHSNLKRTALKDGLSDEDAEARADSQLGDPFVLADEIVTDHRAASWWGRHPILGYIILPLLSLFPAFIVSALLMFGVALLMMSQDQWQTLFQNIKSAADVKPLLSLFVSLFQLQYVALTLFALPFCWMARRSASGLIWATVACAIFAAQGMFFHLITNIRNIHPGYTWDPNWLGLLGPSLLVAGGYFRQWQKLNRLPPLPAHLAAKYARPNPILKLLNTPLGAKDPAPAHATASHQPVREKQSWLKKAVRTPTYWVIVIILVVGWPLFVLSKNHADKVRAGIRAKNEETRNTAQAAEREQVTQDLAARQATRETTHETTINLGPHINVQLSESTDGGKKSTKENSLLELPRGNDIYGGIPFDVQGRIQLMGGGLEQYQRVFPVIAKDIKIGHKCNKIFLFHGENNAGPELQDTTVAKLRLHYTDGTLAEIQIKSGVHLLDWWGFIYKTGIDKNRREISSPDAELAWIGKNDFIKRFRPNQNLRLYKTTFENPQPAKEIATLDYVSTMTQAAPFLLGLTVE